jgi:hypothetical protein
VNSVDCLPRHPSPAAPWYNRGMETEHVILVVVGNLELARENHRLQSEANAIMRELISAIREKI